MKNVLKSGVLLSVATCFISSMAYGAVVEQKTPEWVMKVTYDYSMIDTPSDATDGLNNNNARKQHGVDPKSDIDGSLSGINFTIGKLLINQENPAMVSLDFTYRSGDLDGTIKYHGGVPNEELINDASVDREDLDVKILYQWLGERWQPYVGLGYLRYEKNITDSFRSRGVWTGNNSMIGNVDKELNGVTFGGGLGVNILKLQHLDIKAKTEVFGIYGNGEMTDDREVGDQDIDGTNFGYMAKATLMLNVPFTVSNYQGGVFFDLGYQYQQFDFEDAIGSDDIWYGLYCRAGLGIVF